MAWIRSPTRIASSASWVTSSVGVPASRSSGQRLVAHLRAQRGVQGRERLVEQHQLRLRRQRPGQRHPLLLAAREGVRIGAGVGAHVDRGQQLGHALLARRAGRGRCSPKATFSPTRRCGNRAKSWNIRPTRRRSGGRLRPGSASSRPLSAIRPACSVSSPAIRRKRRGLAAAGGADEAVHLAGRRSSASTRSTTSRVAEAVRQVR